ncbi:uncharacterized protein LOC111301696 isoform X1 [Durio zibethinus]|uniref:Uncharacterized protein LOC111301696 isoform X1 n=1 Tax=Durio zibethinus TaxID=66656 RepID=A0A6P5ZL64_DURZI|nr:uncharacterized protein LOC111301696 isoform X1 [Durio zibethinus]
MLCTAMDEEFSLNDPTHLLESASEFAHHPVLQNDAATKDFLDRFPLPVIISALQTKADVPGLENALVECLEKVFKTKYGASLIPQYMPFVQVGLRADSQIVRCLACKTGRVRVLSLIVKLFSISNSVASVVYNSNLLSLLEVEIRNSNDTLVTLSALELLYELTEIQHGTEFLSRTTLLLLHSIISNSSMESILRSRAMMISGRLLSKENIYMVVDEPSAKGVISAINVRIGLLNSLDTDECLSALEALGQIGSSIQGAVLLLSSFPPAARHIVHAAFDWQGRGKQLAALHALGNVAGEKRPEDSVMLNGDAEENLRLLIYEVASQSSKLTPSGLFLSVLQQAEEFRLAGYRVITGLVARSWCLMEICSKQEIINMVTDPATETTKIGMEARYNCCKAIHRAFMSSKLVSDPALHGIAVKLQDGVQRGPYLARKHTEAAPVVMTAEIF